MAPPGPTRWLDGGVDVPEGALELLSAAAPATPPKLPVDVFLKSAATLEELTQRRARRRARLLDGAVIAAACVLFTTAGLWIWLAAGEDDAESRLAAVNVASTPSEETIAKRPGATVPPRAEEAKAAAKNAISDESGHVQSKGGEPGAVVNHPVGKKSARPGSRLHGQNVEQLPAIEVDELAITGVGREAVMLERARVNIAVDPSAALEQIGAHRAEFPVAELGAERDFLTIIALANLGRGREATKRAEEFTLRFPNSPYLKRIRQTIER